MQYTCKNGHLHNTKIAADSCKWCMNKRINKFNARRKEISELSINLKAVDLYELQEATDLAIKALAQLNVIITKLVKY